MISLRVQANSIALEIQIVIQIRNKNKLEIFIKKVDDLINVI